jgi:hypothetical protein
MFLLTHSTRWMCPMSYCHPTERPYRRFALRHSPLASSSSSSSSMASAVLSSRDRRFSSSRNRLVPQRRCHRLGGRKWPSPSRSHFLSNLTSLHHRHRHCHRRLSCLVIRHHSTILPFPAHHLKHCDHDSSSSPFLEASEAPQVHLVLAKPAHAWAEQEQQPSLPRVRRLPPHERRTGS